jgi:hypothetical protein
VKTIRVHPAAQFQERSRLFKELAQAFSVVFEPNDSLQATLEGPGIVFLKQAGSAERTAISQAKGPCYVICPGTPNLNPVSSSTATVQLRRIPGCPLQFGAFPLSQKAIPAQTTLPVSDGMEVAAATESGPVWTWRRDGQKPHYHVALEPEELTENERLRHHLEPGRNLRLLPLVHFLRALTDLEGFEFPHQSACLALDDPNLHWPSYGYVQFEAMARHARMHRYHVAVAMVPLDTWYANERATRMFKDHRDHISLMMHGNDHTYRELGQIQPEQHCLSRMAQALRRVERFERQTGLSVARVMEPPHGLCSLPYARAMADLGFAGALLTHDRVLECGHGNFWPTDFGLRPLDMVGRYFPLIARSRWTEEWTQTVPISALLGQPITVATHHEDAVGGFENFGTIAQRINSLGGIRWCGFGEMAESLYQTRIHGETMTVRPFSRRVVIHRPEGIRFVVIQPPVQGGEWVVELETGPDSGANRTVEATAENPFALGSARQIRVRSRTNAEIPYGDQPSPGANPWALFRRFLSTARDRTRPFIQRDQPVEHVASTASSNS